MMPTSRPGALTLLLLLSIGIAVGACDERPYPGEGWPSEGQRAEAPNPDPLITPGAARSVIGTWRVRLAGEGDEAKVKLYTFTADGRVTVAPNQVCRYRVERELLAIECAGSASESAQGKLDRPGADTLVWRVDDKIVRLERQAGVKEQQ